jgi:hypothetical protein
MTDKGRVDGFVKRPPKKSRRGIGRSVGPQASVWKGKKYAKKLAKCTVTGGAANFASINGVKKPPRAFREKYQAGMGGKGKKGIKGVKGIKGKAPMKSIKGVKGKPPLQKLKYK